MTRLPVACACLLIPLLLLPLGGASAEESDAGGVEGGVERHPDDPWEPMNRGIFAFNEGLDRWVLEPVAKGWDWAVPHPVQTGIGNFFTNLAVPVHAANELLQAKPWQAYETVWRGAINIMLGFGGVLDIASRYEVYQSDEDFGQTLGYWGTPSGPYLVLPLLGPSNPRDTAGTIVDSFSSPHPYFLPFYVTASAGVVNVVQVRADNLEEIAAERAAAFDFYSAVRGAAIQYRENQVRDRADAEDAEADDDLYYFDEDEE
ncbi:MAG: MlaA family lipoprotein [Myxococcota bacterium]